MIPPAPLVSVIMPSYNHSRYLEEAIDSVLTQTVRDLELIIIDDGSTDDSRRIIERTAERDGRVRASFHEANAGIARTMNEAAALASGKFIAQLASDDIWEPQKLERQLDVLHGDDRLIVWSDGIVIDAEGRPTGALFTHMVKASNRRKSGNILDDLLIGNFILGSSRMMKRPATGMLRWNEELRYLNDYQYVVDLASRHAFHFVSEPLVRYRVHAATTVARDLFGYYTDALRLRRYLLAQYRDRLSVATRLHIERYSLVILVKLLWRLATGRV